ANAGSLYAFQGEVKISDNTVYIQTDNWEFIYNLLLKFNLKKLSFGTGQPLIKSSEIKKLNMWTPDNNSEQQIIGDFLSTIKSLIALHLRKINILKNLKQQYLRVMFVENEKNTPKIRFKSFKDVWRQIRLKEISAKVKEKNTNNYYNNTLTNSAELGILLQNNYFEKEIANAKNLTGYYIVKPDDFVYNPRISSHAPVGPIKKNNLDITGI